VLMSILSAIEARTGKRIHQLFDLICGTSTGGIMAAAFGLRRMSALEVESLFREVVGKVFSSAPPVVADPNKSASFFEFRRKLRKLLTTGGRYDTAMFEYILQEHFSRMAMIDSAAGEGVPKVAFVATLMSSKPPKPYILRNYTYPPVAPKRSRYPGTCERRIYECVRATTAATTLFSEVEFDGTRLSDGAMVSNNPTAIALHEAQCIWGRDRPLDCVLSLGTGKGLEAEQEKGLADLFRIVLYGVTDVERTHEVLEDVLEPDIYYRFNPQSELVDVALDEVRLEKLNQMQAATELYIRDNHETFERLCSALLR